MEIENIIVDVLRDNDYVSLPAIGSFEKQYFPARIDVQEGLIFPHFYTVTFRRDRRFDDGSIAQHLSIRFEALLQEMEQEVITWSNRISNHLDNGHKVFFRGLGTLWKSENELYFEQIKEMSFPFDSFGLQPVKLSPILHIEESEPHRKKWKFILVPLIPIFLLVGIYFYGYHTEAGWIEKLPFKLALGKPMFSSHLPNEQCEQENVVPIETEMVVDMDKAKSLDSSHVQKNALTYQTEDTTDNTTSYFLIAGSFSNPNNAHKHVQQLNDEGFTAEVIVSNSMYRVSIGRFNNKQRALLELTRIRNFKGDSAIWLLERE